MYQLFIKFSSKFYRKVSIPQNIPLKKKNQFYKKISAPVPEKSSNSKKEIPID